MLGAVAAVVKVVELTICEHKNSVIFILLAVDMLYPALIYGIIPESDTCVRVSLSSVEFKPIPNL